MMFGEEYVFKISLVDADWNGPKHNFCRGEAASQSHLQM
jgi:hypothetical protein